MYDQIINFLNTQNWKYQIEEPNSTLLFGISANHGKIDCMVKVLENNSELVILSFCTSKSDPMKFDELIEFITRANFGLLNGGFEFDYSNGLIRFKSTALYEAENPISEKVLRKYIFNNLYIMNLYLPGIMSIMYADTEPVTALNEIEKAPGLCFN